ncbi:uncharacterized protein SPPG_01075 [Spizellomyces punctatus DAOM BR117]|uniref:Protein PBN1 n=1 Tax=Spizellomyces punctatus (strain DAOM BR117) TaxID=645134 RepID=A0A0L0HRT6_SPIPD|nr:uncharacterized protein SPPG_01075 [Spizellomyces punctatus DAOM BR117]KND03600.1 hypothetical protein SPPG_01075 [Spizellomyces punctatus DAOM BR117]|eukprot:XP_016611639.1 hypothetical protein SPPG_01075 [Spizellomyces punctatus DAOM BR117]
MYGKHTLISGLLFAVLLCGFIIQSHASSLKDQSRIDSSSSEDNIVLQTELLPGYGYHQKFQITIHRREQLKEGQLVLLLGFGSAAFADRYEIGRISWPVGVTVACVGDADLEAPAYASTATRNGVLLRVQFAQQSDTTLIISLPYHMRYQAPQAQSLRVAVDTVQTAAYLTRETDVSLPSITEHEFFQLVQGHTDNVLIRSGWNRMEMSTRPYTVEIPVGQISDQGVIGILTYTVTLFGTVLVTWVLLASSYGNNLSKIKAA